MNLHFSEKMESDLSPGGSVRIYYSRGISNGGECVLQHPQFKAKVSLQDIAVAAATIPLAPLLMCLTILYFPTPRPHAVKTYSDGIHFTTFILLMLTFGGLAIIHLGIFLDLVMARIFLKTTEQEQLRGIKRTLLKWDEDHLWLPGGIYLRSSRAAGSKTPAPILAFRQYEVCAYKIALQELRGVGWHSYRISLLRRVGTRLLFPLIPHHARRCIYQTSLDFLTSIGRVQHQVQIEKAEADWLIDWMNRHWNLQPIPSLNRVQGDPWPRPYVNWRAGRLLESHFSAKLALRVVIVYVSLMLLGTLYGWLNNDWPEPDSTRFFLTLIALECLFLSWGVWVQWPSEVDVMERRYRSSYRLEK